VRKTSREDGAEEGLSAACQSEQPAAPSRREVLAGGVGAGVVVALAASCSIPGLPTPTSACVPMDPARVAASRIVCRSRYCRYFRAGVSEGIGVCSGIPCV
jgi:hypothetical protein